MDLAATGAGLRAGGAAFLWEEGCSFLPGNGFFGDCLTVVCDPFSLAAGVGLALGFSFPFCGAAAFLAGFFSAFLAFAAASALAFDFLGAEADFLAFFCLVAMERHVLR